MTKKPQTSKDAAEKVVKNIRRKTRQTYSAEEKIRIVLAGLRGEESISVLCSLKNLGRAYCDSQSSASFSLFLDRSATSSAILFISCSNKRILYWVSSFRFTATTKAMTPIIIAIISTLKPLLHLTAFFCQITNPTAN